MRSDIAGCRGGKCCRTRRAARGRRGGLAVLAGLVVALAGVASARASDDAGAELAARVSQVFEQKCAQCHGPQAKKPKKFNYVTDLARLAANPKLVVPHDPASSAVWTAIDEDEMPPEDSPTRPLSDQEKDVVRQWIEAGTPAGHPSTPPAVVAATTGPATQPAAAAGPVGHDLPPAATAGADEPSADDAGADPAADPDAGPAAAARPAQPFGRRLMRWVGRFHPIIVHFPIALLSAAALAELAWLKSRAPWLTGAVRFSTAFAAVGSVAAGALGWVNAAFHTSSPLLTQHRWLGTTAVLWMLPLVFLCEWGVRRAGAAGGDPFRWAGRSRLAFQLVLFTGVALVGLVGHMGRALVYGENYFRF